MAGLISCHHNPTLNPSVSIQNDSIQVILQNVRNLAYKGRSDSSMQYFSKNFKEYYKKGKIKNSFNILLETAAVYHIWQMKDSTVSVINLAANLLQKYFPTDTDAMASLDYALGKIQLLQGRYNSADSLFRLSIKLRTSICGPEDTLLSPAYNDLGSVYYYKGNYDSALVNYSKALLLSKNRKNQLDREIARYYHNNGLIIKSIGDLKKATTYYNQSFMILRNIMDPNSPDFINMHRNLAFLFLKTGDIDSASREINAAEKSAIFNFGINSFQFAEILELKAQVSYLKKNYDQANTYYETALEIFSKDPIEYIRDISYIETGLGNLDMDHGVFDSARVHFQKAAESNLKYFPQEAGNAVMSLAYSYELGGLLLEARKEYIHAIQITKLYYGDDYFLLGLGYRMLGTIEGKLKNYTEALNDFKTSINIFTKNYGEKSENVAQSYVELADMYSKIHEYQIAISVYNTALQSYLPLINDSTFNFSLSKVLLQPDDNLVLILLHISDAYYASQETMHDEVVRFIALEKALKYIDLGIHLLEIQRNSILTEKDQLEFSEKISSSCKRASEICYSMFNLRVNPIYADKAKYYSGKRKLMVLRSMVNDIQAKEIGGVPEFIIMKEKSLRSRIANLQALINNAMQSPSPTETQISYWKKDLFHSYRAMDSLREIFQKSYPEYYKLKFDLTTSMGNEIKVNPGEAILEYDLDSNQLITYLTTSDRMKLNRQELDTAFKSDVRKFINILSKPGDPDRLKIELQEYLECGEKLYNILIKPFAKQITNNRLIIIPDDILGLVPFEALPVPGKSINPVDFSEIGYLVRFYPVRYEYYSGMLLNNENIKHLPGNNVLAFAPGYQNPQIKFSAADSVLPTPLPESILEVKKIISCMGGKYLIANDATKDNFFQLVSKYPIIQLSMHTNTDPADPMNSSLIFSPSRNGDYVTTAELYKLQLNNPLVVLSACNTGSGNILHSEGLINIARGFQYAGAGSMVITLWDIADFSSSSLINDFYKELHSTKPKDIALQNARIKGSLMNDPVKAHPYYWAGYILIGDASPIKPYPYLKIFIIVVLPSLLVILVLFFQRIKKNFKSKSDE